MRRLDRYILGEFLAPLGLIVFGLASLVLLVQVVDQLPRLREWHPSATLLLLYYVFQFPYLVTQVVPVAVMLATLIALGGLARGSELTAMGAGGVSRARLAMPILLAALGISVTLLALSETVVPEATERSLYIQKVQIEKRNIDWDQPWRTDMAKNLPDGRQLYTATFDAQDGTMKPLILIGYGPQGGQSQRIDAQEARWLGGGRWMLSQGVERLFDAQGREASTRFFDTQMETLGASPTDFAVDVDRRVEDLMELSIAKLRDIAARLSATGGDAREANVCVQVRVSYPFSCLILALLGVGLPYLFPTGKRALTGAALGLVAALACGMLYLVFIQVGVSLGTSSTLPAPLSAWLGNLVFGAAGALILWKVNR